MAYQRNIEKTLGVNLVKAVRKILLDLGISTGGGSDPAATQTLTNKTINGNNNTLSNIPIASIASLQGALDGKSNVGHFQAATTITGLAPVAISGAYTDITGRPNLATVATTGVYTDLTSKPTIPTVVSALTNDSGYQTAGQVTTAIAGKQNTLVSGTSIKTINGTSVLGSGDLVISGGSGTIADGSVTAAKLAPAVSAKLQDTMIDVVKAYGVVADNSTDNATALMQMRTDLAGGNKPLYHIYLPAGTIRSSNNRWLYGIERFVLHGSGTKIQTIYSGGDDALARPLWVGELIQNNVLAYNGGKSYKTAFKFNTVGAGAITITLTTTSQISNFAVGNRILLFADDKYGSGYPPATIKNEYVVIKSINAGAGTITINTPLRYNYNSNVHEIVTSIGSGPIGKPSIINLDDPLNVYNRYAEFNDVFLADPTGGQQGHMSFPSEHLVFNNVKQENGYWWPSENKLAEYNAGCQFINAEPDKLTDTVICEGITMQNETFGALGIRHFEARNSKFGPVGLAPREFIMKDCQLTSGSLPDPSVQALSNQPTRTAMEYIDISNLTVNSTPGNTSVSHLNPAPFNTFTISAVSGMNILVPNTTSFADVLPYKLDEGTTIFKSDGSNGGQISGITYDATYNSNQGAWIIAGNWRTAPAASETWAFCYVKRVFDRGGHLVKDGKKLWDGQSIRWKGNTRASGDVEFFITEQDLVWSTSTTSFGIDINGWIRSIKLDVKRPHSGVLSSNLSIDRNTPSYAGLIAFDLLKTGYREYDAFGTQKTTTTGEAAPDAAVMRAWSTQIAINLYGSKTALTANDLPQFVLSIRYTPFG